MGTAGRLAGLAVVVSLGCSFDSTNANDSSQLGSSAGSVSGDPTSDSDEGETGQDAVGSGGAEGDTSAGGSTSVGSDESCVDACGPQVPAGWVGPYYVADAANPIDCPNGYNAQDLAYGGLQAPAASCECSCDAAPGTCEVEFLMSTAGCFAGVTLQLGNGECDGLNAAGFDVHARATLIGSPTSCTPNVIQNAAPPTWDSATTFCAAPARGGDCGGDRCTALPPEGVATRLCISKDGDEACPGGGYDQRTVLHRTFSDNRTCQGCNCSGQPACTGQAFAHDEGNCSDSAQTVPFNQCFDISVSGSYGMSASVDGGSCTATDASPAGEAIPADPVTICCAT